MFLEFLFAVILFLFLKLILHSSVIVIAAATVPSSMVLSEMYVTSNPIFNSPAQSHLDQSALSEVYRVCRGLHQKACEKLRIILPKIKNSVYISFSFLSCFRGLYQQAYEKVGMIISRLNKVKQKGWLQIHEYYSHKRMSFKFKCKKKMDHPRGNLMKESTSKEHIPSSVAQDVEESSFVSTNHSMNATNKIGSALGTAVATVVVEAWGLHQKACEKLRIILPKMKISVYISFSFLSFFRGLYQQAYEKVGMIISGLNEVKQKGWLQIHEYYSHKRMSFKFECKKKMDHPRGNLMKESISKEHIPSSVAQDVEGSSFVSTNHSMNATNKIGSALGTAVATVVVEVFNNDYEKADTMSTEIAKLLGVAVKESLNQVLYAESEKFSKEFELSFRSTFSTILQVRKEKCNMQNLSACSWGKVQTVYPQKHCETNCYEADVNRCIHSVCGRSKDEWKYMEYQIQNYETAFELGIESVDGSEGRGPEKHPNILTVDQTDYKISKDHECLTSELAADCDSYPATDETVNQDIARDSGCAFSITDLNSNDCLKHSRASSSEVETTHLEGFGESIVDDCNETSDDRQVKSIHENSTCKEIFKSKGKSVVRESCHRTVFDNNDQHGQEGKSKRMQRKTSEGMPKTSMLAVLSNQKNCSENQYRENMLDLLDKSFREQEKENYLKCIELRQNNFNFQLAKQQLQAQLESNKLMQEKLYLNRSKASFKENVFVDQKQNKACSDLIKACADEFLAGMLLMLSFLAYGVWQCSHALLSDAVSSCRSLSTASQKTRWYFSNPWDTVTNSFNLVLCHIKVFSNVIAGVFLFLSLVYFLTRFTVANSSQAMPATVTLVILGGLGGWVGKFFVDSLGGSGFRWLMYWEALCILHAFATCFTPCLYYLLNGPNSRSVGTTLIPYWSRKFVFHATLILILPAMAGLTPFASSKDWFAHFSKILVENVYEPSILALQDKLQQF